MSTTAYSSQGIQLQVTISSTPTLVPQIVGFTGPSTAADYYETTNLDSASGFKEWQIILRDGGTVPFDMIWVPENTVHQYLETANQTGQNPEQFTILFNGASHKTRAFKAYVSKFEFKATKGQAQLIGVELKVTGAITAS